MAELSFADVRRMLHDLRQPLAAISIQLELLEQASQLRTRKNVSVMRASMDHAIAAIKRIEFALEDACARAPTDRATKTREQR